MSIRIDRSVGQIVGSPDSIAVQVQDASDPEAAAGALALAANDICAVVHPKFVSPVSRAGTGPLIIMDAVDSPRRLLARIPELIATRLKEAGVVDATIACPASDGPLARMFGAFGNKFPRSVSLHLYAPPPTNHAGWQGPRPPVPDSWLNEAVAWLAEGLGDDDELYGQIVNVEFPVPVADAHDILRQTADARDAIDLVSGNLGHHIRQVSLQAINLPRLMLSAAGPATTDDELLTLGAMLIGAARRVAGDAAYAIVSVDPSLWTGVISDWQPDHGGENPSVAESLCDEYVLDAFPYQVLGPGHLARLGRIPTAEPLPNGRMGVAVGELADWLLNPPEEQYKNYPHFFKLCERRRNPSISEQGRQLLAPCLLRDGEGYPLLEIRHQPAY